VGQQRAIRLQPLGSMNEERLSISNSGDGKLSKNEKRDAAREKSRLMREEQKKKDRRTRALLQGGIILGSLAIVAIIALVLVNSIRPAGPGPANMASDGIQIKQGGLATTTPALASDAAPVPNKRDSGSGVLTIQLYVDYLCPFCGQFEKTNADYISSLLDSGATTLEIHPISILDSRSQGTKYSTRAVNAAACVANYSPDQFSAFHGLLFANQPAENSSGLSDDQLIGYATQASVQQASKIGDCIRNQTFKAWVSASSDRALKGPIPDSSIEKVIGTPTVIVNGQKYEGAVDNLAAFQAFVLQAAGENFNQNSTATPTPTPSAG